MVRRQFAEKANQVGPWIERQMDAVTAIGMGLQVGDMNQLRSLFSICTNLIQNKNNRITQMSLIPPIKSIFTCLPKDNQIYQIQ